VYKTKLLIALFLIGIFSVTAVYSCHINFKPKKLNIEPDTPTSITVFVELEHRRCQIPIEDTIIKSNNIEIMKQGSWERLSRNKYKIDLMLILKGEKGELIVFRECDKKGISEGIMKVTAK